MLCSIDQTLNYISKISKLLKYVNKMNATNFDSNKYFIDHVDQIIINNLQNNQFGVGSLAADLGISQHSLNERLKMLKEKTVAQYIKEVRLEEARKLLGKDSNISEVAYKVGFSSASYFNQCFSEKYGISPSKVNKKSNEFKKVERKRIKNQLKKLDSYIVLFVAAIFIGVGLFLVSFEKAEKSIAVLPFTNLSHNNDTDYLVAGIQDNLISTLGKINGLKVISKTSSMRFKESTLEKEEIANVLGVNTLMQGSAFIWEDSITLQVNLYSINEEEKLIWQGKYKSGLVNILSIQNEVMKKTIDEVALSLDNKSEIVLSNSRIKDINTYKSYLRGMYHVQRDEPQEFKKGIAYLQEVIETGNADPLIYAGLAFSFTMQYHGSNPQKDFWEVAEEAATKAIALAPDLAEAHAALAFIYCYYHRDWTKAEIAFQKAMKINPNLAINHFHYAWFLAIFGKFDEAIKHHEIAKELDPFTPIYSADLSNLYIYAGLQDEAIQEAKYAIKNEPEFDWNQWALGNAFVNKGLFDEAIEAHQSLVSIDQNWKWALANTYARTGNRKKAKSLLHELESDTLSTRNYFGLAMCYTSLKEFDKAFEYLEMAEGDMWLPWIRTWPEFYPLRNDQRFNELLTTLKLPLVEEVQ